MVINVVLTETEATKTSIKKLRKQINALRKQYDEVQMTMRAQKECVEADIADLQEVAPAAGSEGEHSFQRELTQYKQLLQRMEQLIDQKRTRWEILNINDAGTVTLQNITESDLSLSGYVLTNEANRGAAESLQFADDVTVPAGGSIEIVSGPDAKSDVAKGVIGWPSREPIWNEDFKVAVLREPGSEGAIVAVYFEGSVDSEKA